jgi:hypothetical protein
MKAIIEGDRIVGIELTRRNLETLLLKLDREDSQRTIAKLTPGGYFLVMSVENDAHYEAEGRPAGEMHAAEETLISRPTTGVLPA